MRRRRIKTPLFVLCPPPSLKNCNHPTAAGTNSKTLHGWQNSIDFAKWKQKQQNLKVLIHLFPNYSSRYVRTRLVPVGMGDTIPSPHQKGRQNDIFSISLEPLFGNATLVRTSKWLQDLWSIHRTKFIRKNIYIYVIFSTNQNSINKAKTLWHISVF